MNKRAIRNVCILFVTGIFSLLMTETHPALASSFVVDSTGDETDLAIDGICATSLGECTLRAAIMEANRYVGTADEITFNIPGSVPVPRFIFIDSELPPITTATIIRGPNSDGGAIYLEGQGGDYNGLYIWASNSEIRKLNIRDFGQNGIHVKGLTALTGITIAGNYLGTTSTTVNGNGKNGIYFQNVGSSLIGGDTAADRNIISKNGNYGILIEGGGVNLVRGNYIGTDQTGTLDRGNQFKGIRILNSSGNTIGGSTSSRCNLISGNESGGVEILGDDNYVLGNYIGTDVNGTAAIPNGGFGVAVISYGDSVYYGNFIGGTIPGEGNLISGNESSGIQLQKANETTVQGNIIGLNANQTGAIPNLKGITLAAGQDNLIGGAVSGAGNVIGGNTSNGISLSNTSTSLNTVQGNRIGVSISGAAFPNGGSGVTMDNTDYNTLGGTGTGEGNIIAYNGGDGVTLFSFASFNQIIGNAIFGNTGLGIDLYQSTDPTSGVTPNDLGDEDAVGPNYLQNYPMLTKAVYTSSTSVTVQGWFNSQSDSNYTIHFYGNDSCDPSGYGEGQVYLGLTNVKTDGDGNATISRMLTVAQKTMYITATATDVEGNTSEFSTCRSASTIYLPLVIK